MKLSDSVEEFIGKTDSKQPSRRSLNATKNGAYSYLARVRRK